MTNDVATVEKEILKIHLNTVKYMNQKEQEMLDLQKQVHPEITSVLSYTAYEQFKEDPTEAVAELKEADDFKNMSNEEAKLELEAAFELERLILDIRKAVNMLLQQNGPEGEEDED